MKAFFYVLIFTAIFSSCSSTTKQQPAASPEISIQQLIRSGRNQDAAARFQYNYDIDAQDEDGNTALHVAAEQNAHDLVKRFIVVGANMEIKNHDGDTPIHVAISNDSYESAEILSKFENNLFLTNAQGVSALEAGVARSHKYYDLFITEKTGEMRDKDGRSIVHYFAQTCNGPAIRNCIEKKLPLSVRDKNGYTPLDIAFEMAATNENAVQVASDLIQADAAQVTTEYNYFQTAVKNRNMDYRFDDGQTPLHHATINGHTSIVSYLLKNNAKTASQDSNGATPLHEAVRYGRADIATLLLASGANVNAEDNIGKTPVMLIIPDGQQEIIYDLLIAHNADIRHKDSYGDTVLHTAEMTNIPLPIIRKLVMAGAQINERNKEGVTPIMLAIENNSESHVKFYAQNGADIHSTSKTKASPLVSVLKTENLLPSLILPNNVMTRDTKGNTPLHIAINEKASIDKIQYIASMMSDVNTLNSNGDSSLLLATAQNNSQVGKFLLTRNADIFATNDDNNSPLRLALQPNNPAAAWLLTPETIKAKDGFGNTPLHYAAEWGMGDAIVFLITNGANPSEKNANGETAIFNAAKTDKPNIINQLIVGGSSIFAKDNIGSTPLHTSVRWNSINSASYLVSHGIDIDAQNLSGKSALAEAVAIGNTEIAHILLENGANINLTDNHGRTILMDSIKSESAATVELLLQYGANPQVQEMNGRNAYHEAALSGNKEIISLIRKAGGNPLIRDKNGNTPFLLSLDKGEDVIIELLGQDKTISDSDGNTPAHIAVSKRISPTVMELLVKNGYPIDNRNAIGATPLSLAVSRNDVGNARVLLANGANPFVSIDKNGTNAAVMSLNANSTEILEEMAKYAGTKSDMHGNTLLHYAARIASPETVEFLLSLGLDTDATNISDETPYETALRWNRADVAKILQQSN